MADRQDPPVQTATGPVAVLDLPASTPRVVPRERSDASPGPPRPALPQIYEECFGYVWTCLKRLGVWERDLEDAAHDVFLVVHRRLPDYDPTRPLKPWLAGIAARVASEFRRRAQHRREVVSEDVHMESASVHHNATPSAETALDDKRRRDLVQRALERLAFDRRTVLVLHDIEGHAMPEVAAALEININTLYARLRSARQDFAAAVRALSEGSAS
jgi:RNA polymerase sigma-70 factor (ECF subfamily)